MSFFFPSMTSYFGRNPLSTSTARSFLGRSFTWPREAFTTKFLPRYLLIVFAFAGDSTITRAFAIKLHSQNKPPPWMAPSELPHFNKVAPGQLLHGAFDLQFEQGCDDLRRGDLLTGFDQGIEVGGRVY